MTDLMRLDELFDISYGNKFDLVAMSPDPESGIAFVGRKGSDQGVSGYVNEIDGVKPFPVGTITVALGGSILSTFVQMEPFYTAQNVAVLCPKEEGLSWAGRLFYKAVIEANKSRYQAFGREANRTLPSLMVPAQVPDWVHGFDVENVLGGIDEPVSDGEVVLPDASTWGLFRLDELFEIHKGERIVASSQESGAIAYVGGSRFDNGVTERFDIEPSWPAGAVTVSYNGSVGFATVQPESFHASDDVNVFIERKPMSDAVKFFVCTLIRQEAVRFCYGRKWTLVTMKSTTIRLPITASGEPDWDLIESYMMTLRWSQALTR